MKNGDLLEITIKKGIHQNNMLINDTRRCSTTYQDLNEARLA